MSDLDHSLVYEAQKLVNAENVHRVRTWIFCYETSMPDSPHRRRYEKLLRDLVATRRVLLGMRMQADAACTENTYLPQEAFISGGKIGGKTA